MENCCRICLTKDVSSFKSIFLIDKNESYSEKILYLTGLEILENDHLPKNICEECCIAITSACELKRKVIANEAHLKNQNTSYNEEVIEINETKKKKRVSPKNFHSFGFSFLCQTCGKSFKFRNLLEKHLRADHLNQVLFHCDLCTYATKYKINLKRHLTSFHLNLRNFSCLFGDGECKAKYSTQVALNLHLYRSHNEIAPVRCLDCDQGFTYESELRVHQKHCTRGKSIKTRKQDAAVDILENGDFRCQICSKLFDTRAKFSIHFNHKHKRSNICEICNKKMASSTSLAKHIQIKHEQIRKFQCAFCEKSFGHNHTLQAHLNMHTNSKPHKCPQCNFATGDRSSISKHKKKCHS